MAAPKLVEQAMTVEKAGISGSRPASKTSSRPIFEIAGSGMTWPQIRKSGRAFAAIAAATGRERSRAVYFAKEPPAFTKGVRKPDER